MRKNKIIASLPRWDVSLTYHVIISLEFEKDELELGVFEG